MATLNDDETRTMSDNNEEEESTVAWTACPSILESQQGEEESDDESDEVDTIISSAVSGSSMGASNSLAKEVLEAIQSENKPIERIQHLNPSYSICNVEDTHKNEIVISSDDAKNDVESGLRSSQQGTTIVEEDVMAEDFASRLQRLEDAIRSKEDTRETIKPAQIIPPPENTRFQVLAPRLQSLEEVQNLEEALRSKEATRLRKPSATQQQTESLQESTPSLLEALAYRLQTLEEVMLSKEVNLQLSSSAKNHVDQQSETPASRQFTLENRLRALEGALAAKQDAIISCSVDNSTTDAGLEVREKAVPSYHDGSTSTTPCVASMMQARLQALESDVAIKKAAGNSTKFAVGGVAYQLNETLPVNEAQMQSGDHPNESSGTANQTRSPDIEHLPRFRRKASGGSSSANSSTAVSEQARSHSSSISPGAIRVTNPLGRSNYPQDADDRGANLSHDSEMVNAGALTPTTAFGSDEEIHGELGTEDDQRIIQDAFNGMVEVPAKILDGGNDDRSNARVKERRCQWAISTLVFVVAITLVVIFLTVGKGDRGDQLQSEEPVNLAPAILTSLPSFQPSQAPTRLAWELVDTAIIDGSTFFNESERIVGFARDIATVDMSKNDFMQNRNENELLVAVTNQQEYVMVSYFCDEVSCRDGFFVESEIFPSLSNISDSYLAKLGFSATGRNLAVAVCKSYFPCEVLLFDLAKTGIDATGRGPLTGGNSITYAGQRVIDLVIDDEANHLAILSLSGLQIIDISQSASELNQAIPESFVVNFNWAPPTREEPSAIASDGNVFAVGTTIVDPTSLYFDGMKVRIFDNLGRNTAPVLELEAPFSFQSENSLALAANGTLLAIGYTNRTRYWGQRDLGRVGIYQLKENQWSQLGPTVYGSGQLEDSFGGSVLLSHDGSILVVGAPRSDFDGAEEVGTATTYR